MIKIFLSTAIICLYISLASPKTWADTFNLYNGQVINGHLKEIVGELVRYKRGYWGNPILLNRLKLTNRMDKVVTHNGKVYRGEVVYIDPIHLEVRTDRGDFKLFRFWVKHITLGTPKSQTDQ